MKPIPFILMFELMLASAATPAATQGMEAILDKLGVNNVPESLAPAPIPGFVEITRGIQVLYVSTDGGFVIKGDILSVETETNLTENRRARIRRELLHSIPDDETLIVPASASTIARLVIFTDTDCRYCQRLHKMRDELSRSGIEIQYLFYPRSGPTTTSFDQAVAVWCSGDRLTALDRTLGGEKLPKANCANPVTQHFGLARDLDLKGTPAVITADGGVHYGVYSPRDLAALAQAARSSHQ